MSAERSRWLQCLGLPATADAIAIKTAYRQLARQWHPDRNPDPQATARFQEIQVAYERLLVLQESAASQPIPPTPPTDAAAIVLKRQLHLQLQDLLADGRWAKAIVLAEALQQRLPEDWEVRQWLALCYLRQGQALLVQQQRQRAIAYFEKARRTDPHNPRLQQEIQASLRQASARRA
ncbi:J domain-containing protein [Synechococcus elongatus]|uniref:DnaJ domain-containing protein n=1 Tax=Synechococcus elongatus PCC 11802 TaxID=2283154 RepID=A0AAT9JXF0_SYNEL|nr:DnaJ domain-containing protein [Synechococcus elongatus]QFZ91654.1 molecular chaperone DnaJ [Synechococcus elongatus PCC 11802]